MKNESLKSTIIGAGLGLFSALFIWVITASEWSFMTEVVDGYEFRSYDARFRGKTADYEEESIDDVVIIDIDQESISELGNYFRWFHDYHGDLLNYLQSGEPKAILFDIIFDPEPIIYHDTSFVKATNRSGNVYHAFALSETDSLNFQYAMDAPPQGTYFHDVVPGETFESIATIYDGDYPVTEHTLRDYNKSIYAPGASPEGGSVVMIPMPMDTDRLTLKLPEGIADQFPSGERFDHNFIGLLNASRGVGAANFPADIDGIIRRSPTAVYFSTAKQPYPSLTVAAAMDILGIPKDGLEYDFDKHILTMRNSAGEAVREIPIDDNGRIYVNYYGKYRTFRYIPYSWANENVLPSEYFKDKIILIGSSLPGLMDLRSTPVQPIFAGVEIHANVIKSIIDGQFVKPASRATTLNYMLLISIILGIIIVRFGIFTSLVVSVITVGVWILFIYYKFMVNLEMYQMVRPVIAVATTSLSVYLYQFLVLDKDKRFLKKTFTTYISPELIEEMVANNVEPELGGESGIHTAYFTDIQSFSSFSELLSASKLVELLNEYLTAMTDTLLEEGGTLDKYEGDAIVSFFGAPLPMEDHAARAFRTALGMQQKLADLRKKWGSEGDKWPDLVQEMRMRIGINTGEFVTGNMGSAMRMNYTMMGDIVNTAARLEASAKVYGIYIQPTMASLQAAGPDDFEWREIDKVRVMGKSEAVETVELMGEKGSLSPELIKMREIYNEGMALYKQQAWDKAKAKFIESEALEEVFPKRPTTPSAVYQERCDHFKANPPGENWDGAWTLTSK